MQANHNGLNHRVRLIGAFLAGGGLTLGIVVCHLSTNHVPEVLNYGLLVIVGWLCREATLPEYRHGPVPTRNGQGPGPTATH